MEAKVIALRKPAKGTFLTCSDHPCCEGPHIREDHDAVCDAGAECDNDTCWRGCQFCKPDDTA